MVAKYGFSEDRNSLFIMTKSAYVWRDQDDGDSIAVPITNLSKDEFSEDELKAVIAHEIGHILYGHTTALLLNIIGNGVFSVFVIVAKCVITILDLLQTPFEKRTRGISYLFISLLRSCLTWFSLFSCS